MVSRRETSEGRGSMFVRAQWTRSFAKGAVACVAAVFVSMSAASAALVEVGFRALLEPSSSGPNPGSGAVTGIIGVFDVTAVGDVFDLLADGSPEVSTFYGFTPGFIDGDFNFTQQASVLPLEFQFSMVDLETESFSGFFPVGGEHWLTTEEVPCSPFDIDTVCWFRIGSGIGAPASVLAFFAAPGGATPYSFGQIEFTYRLVDQTPSEVPVPAALPLMIAGLAGVGFAARKRRKGGA